MIIILPYILAKNFNGVALYPFIIVRNNEVAKNVTIINHERIHLRQQLEMLVLPFFIWYALEFLYKWIKYRDSIQAYFNLSFEKEAYDNEYNTNYLKEKKIWSFTKYL